MQTQLMCCFLILDGSHLAGPAAPTWTNISYWDVPTSHSYNRATGEVLCVGNVICDVSSPATHIHTLYIYFMCQ